ncbi:hypothetical protein CEXT_465651 [Caerostris extrusa]|uniref:Uncharacterized protein n=1 Tax=Caerostris extrusa TaxID=172846 RepID=A0AAV4XUK1_CAEEX|nr:hypothetical protein CEXT_465651 [Caerostris extrusa]
MLGQLERQQGLSHGSSEKEVGDSIPVILQSHLNDVHLVTLFFVGPQCTLLNAESATHLTRVIVLAIV